MIKVHIEDTETRETHEISVPAEFADSVYAAFGATGKDRIAQIAAQVLAHIGDRVKGALAAQYEAEKRIALDQLDATLAQVLQ